MNGIESTTTAFQKMHDDLLRKDFPSAKDHDDVVRFNDHVKTLVMNEEAPKWEKVLAYVITNHLVNCKIDIGLIQMLSADRDFRRSFHKIMAQETCLRVFKDKALTDRVHNLLVPFQDLQSLDSKEMLPVIKVITSGNLEIKERLQVYQFVNAASTFLDPVIKLWKKEIENHKTLPLSLALVWKELYPTLESDSFHILNFEYLIFMDRK